MESNKDSKFKELVANLESFISKENHMLSMSREIESLLDELYPEEEIVEDFIGDLSLYSPSGGDHLYDFEEMLPKIKTILIWVKNNEPT